MKAKLRFSFEEKISLSENLLREIKKKLPELKKLLDEVQGHWSYEDRVYRFYHNSYKVLHLQSDTLKILEALRSVMPDLELNSMFEQIVREGTGKEFSFEEKIDWLKETRPILEAFFHAKFFLEMTVKYGEELNESPQTLPSGWATVLYLYNLR